MGTKTIKTSFAIVSALFIMACSKYTSYPSTHTIEYNRKELRNIRKENIIYGIPATIARRLKYVFLPSYISNASDTTILNSCLDSIYNQYLLHKKGCIAIEEGYKENYQINDSLTQYYYPERAHGYGYYMLLNKNKSYVVLVKWWYLHP